MQLITLNIWGGHVNQPLLDFFSKNQNVDIFCLQEVYHNATYKIATDDRYVDLNIFDHIQRCLPKHCGIFAPTVGDNYGVATFVKQEITLINHDNVIVHHNPDYSGYGPLHSRNLQRLTCNNNNHDYTVLNVHGLWNGQGKTDTKERLAQSQLIKNCVSQVHTAKILCGDFNLRPDTQSLQLIGRDMRDLVKEYAITSTRTRLYPKAERFADYIFVSQDVVVDDFKVLPDEVSDHSPLLLCYHF